jgi:hypothetical protein
MRALDDDISNGSALAKGRVQMIVRVLVGASSGLALTMMFACGPGERDHGNGDGNGDGPDAAITEGDAPASATDCADGAQDVYTFDINEHIYRFDPPSKTFSDLGALNCPYTPSITHPVTPYSMGVDRNTFAWVVYTSGELFKVDINNQLACTKTSWTPSPARLTTFGMGFSTDVPNGTTDSLFVLGESIMPPTFGFELATLDTTSFTTSTVSASMADVAEMTGNSKAELWAFFPRPSPKVVQLDKTNGSVIKDFPEPAVARSNPGFAFAHWGGDFWLFIGDYNLGETSTVYQIDGATGAIKSTTAATGRTIVGAGVSTCAPIVLL